MNDRWLLDFFKALRICITSLRIYPLNNATVQNALTTVEKLLEEFLQTHESMTITEHSGRVNVVGYEVASGEVKSMSEDLARNFTKSHITSITIKKDFSRDEIIFIVLNFGKFYRGDWAALADEKGFKHLSFNQVKYVAVSEEETVVTKVSMLVSEKGGDLGGVMAILKDSYDLIDGAPENSRPKIISHLAVELSKQEPGILREIFDRELPLKVEESGIKDKLVAALTKDKITDVYQEIIRWYDDLKRSGISEFQAVEHLDKLKNFLSLILKNPAAHNVPFKFYEELFKLGLIDSIPEWVKKDKLTENLLEQIEIILNLPDEELITSLWAEKLPDITEKLLDAQLKDNLIKLEVKIINNYKNPDDDVRTKTIEILNKVFAVLKTKGYENILAPAENMLLEWIDQEKMRGVYESLCSILFDRLTGRILAGEYDGANRVYEAFSKLCSDINLDDSKRKYVAEFVERKIAQLMPLLVNDIKSADELKKKNAFEFLSKLGTEALDPLIKIVKEADDLKIRVLAAGILKNLGTPAQKRLKEELNLGLIKDEITKFLEVIGFMGDIDFSDELKTLLRYPDDGIKSEILRYLSDSDAPGVDACLIEYLHNQAVAPFAVKLIAKRKSSEGILALIHLLESSKNWSLKEDIIVAMGENGDNRLSAVIIKLLNSRGGIFRKMTTAQEKARLRAAYALRKFAQSAEIIKALKSAMRDKSQAVSITAAESLRVLESRK